MLRTFYVELTGVMRAYGEAWVEVEEVVDSDGNVNEEFTIDRARDAAMQDVVDGKIDWELGDVADSTVEIAEIKTDGR